MNQNVLIEDQEEENFTERLAVYVTPSLRDRITQARLAAGFTQPDWIRRALEAAAQIHERGQSGMGRMAEVGRPSAESSADLAAAEATIEGLKAIVELQRERIGMGDALNIELTKILQESSAAVNTLTRALPAPGETSEGRGFRWRFWRR